MGTLPSGRWVSSVCSRVRRTTSSWSSESRNAELCSTDYNEAEQGGIGAYVFRLEDGDAQEFHYLNLDGIKGKGGASAILPRPGGGFMGLLVGTDEEVTPNGYPEEPPTAIGLARWSADGTMEGGIDWLVKNDQAYLSYSTIGQLGPDRYLLGWGEMFRLGDEDDGGEISMRIPWTYYLMEIDGAGTPLTDRIELDGPGWGELDEFVPLGEGRLGWTYIPDPALTPDYGHPECNQPQVEMSVYTIAGG